ncbi:unnamed protein product [Eruca vesicaria subsp. sativa]|uniref:Elongation factor Ts, mitochondrial n=1 Tax=Eruca vesicaria subsp. sativa TaxID=29727 RepID=A0ABC8J642_ERUVS|nr:unnamed protein product [Eruca vesicaria subsp. sativa]
MAFARVARRPIGVFFYNASGRFSSGNEYSTVATKLETLSHYKTSVLLSRYASPSRGFGNFLRRFSSESPAVVDQMSLIKQLRQRTSAPIKDVKASLVECNWDIEAAQKDLRKRGKVLASKKSSRTAAEGMLAVAQDEGKVAVIELNCETDFVARNDIFQYLALAMAKRALLVENSSQEISGVFPFGPEVFEAESTGKSQMAVEKMVEGRLRKYYEEVALLEQKFIVNDSINIKTLVDNLSKEVGSPVKVANFLRVEVGEGIERLEASDEPVAQTA